MNSSDVVMAAMRKAEPVGLSNVGIQARCNLAEGTVHMVTSLLRRKGLLRFGADRRWHLTETPAAAESTDEEGDEE